MRRWLRELFDFGPSRIEVALEQQNRDLRESLEYEREQRKFYQDRYINLLGERSGQRSAVHNPISTKSESWSSMKQRLEQEDREKLAEAKKAYENAGSVR